MKKNSLTVKVDPDFYDFWNKHFRSSMSFREFTRRLNNNLKIYYLNLSKLKSKLTTKEERVFGLKI
jgi:hypothetical protein